jgi:drug/metabolite transporter (DMT)-like permease
VVIGLLMFTFIRHYRTSFLNALRVNSKPILGLNVLNEGLYISGNYVAALVVVMIPVSLTLLMNSFQPLFVLVIGLLLTVLFPNSGVEYINRRNMVQKLLAIALTGAGVLLLGGY